MPKRPCRPAPSLFRALLVLILGIPGSSLNMGLGLRLEHELSSKLPERGYIGDYMGEY